MHVSLYVRHVEKSSRSSNIQPEKNQEQLKHNREVSFQFGHASSENLEIYSHSETHIMAPFGKEE